MARVVLIIQARMSSSRLPGKVLMDIEGVPMLGRVVDRARRAEAVDEVVVATSREPSDDAIAEFCAAADIRLARGSHYDVLDRYYATALANHADVVVRITGDCPLIDPELVQETIGILEGSGSPSMTDGSDDTAGLDLALNRLPPPWKRSYPIGLDTEACYFAALERSWREATEPAAREHVMPFLYEGLELEDPSGHVSVGVSRNGFHVALLNHSVNLGELRWTVDTLEDLAFARTVFREFGGASDFSWLDVVRLIEASPEIASINARVSHKSWNDFDERAQADRAR